MPYQLPTLEQLKGIIDGLRMAYTNSNALRLSCITVLEQIAASIDLAPAEERQDILIGALGFVLLDIMHEYNYTMRSPEGGVFYRGSELYKFIKTNLNLMHQSSLTLEEQTEINSGVRHPESLMNDDCQFVYLGRFYLYLSRPTTHLHLSSTCWKLKSELLVQIEANLLRLKKREETRLNDLQAARPTLDAIEIEMDKLCVNYAGDCAGRLFSPATSRKRLVDFMRFIRQTCKDAFPREAVLQDEDLYLRSCYVRLGLIMYMLLEINREYSLFDPSGNWLLGKMNGSQLFRFCKETLNISDLTNLTCAEKTAWLSVLNHYVMDIAGHRQRYENDAGFKELNYHRDRLNHYCSNQSELHNQPGLPMRVAMTATSHVTTYVASAVATQVIGTAVIGTAVMQSAGVSTVALTITAFAGPAGWLALGAGTLIVSQLVRTALPTAVGYAGSYIFKLIGDLTGKWTRSLIHNLSKNKPEGYYELLNHPRLTPEERLFIKKWIEVTLRLPDSITSAAEKEQIRSVLGIASNDALFEVHSDLAPVFTSADERRFVSMRR